MWNSAGITPDFAGPRRLAILAFGKAEEDEVYGQLTGASQLRHRGSGIPNIARSGQLDALIALAGIGTRLRFRGDGFGLESTTEPSFSTEAVKDVTVTRYPRAATERLTEENPAVARRLRDMTLKSLAAALGRLMILGRMTATERVASFLLELSKRNDDEEHVELPMCRCDIGDYLGITIETMCRVLSDLKRRGVVDVSSHSITLLDRFALEAIGED